MAKEIINKLRSKSTIFITGNTDSVISLANLSADAVESVTNAVITHASSSSDGKWTVYRGTDANGVIVLELFGQNFMPLNQHDIAISNTSGSGLFITNSGTGGTLILQVSKTAIYNPPITEGV